MNNAAQPAAGQAANALDAWLAHVQQVDARYPDLGIASVAEE